MFLRAFFGSKPPDTILSRSFGCKRSSWRKSITTRTSYMSCHWSESPELRMAKKWTSSKTARRKSNTLLSGTSTSSLTLEALGCAKNKLSEFGFSELKSVWTFCTCILDQQDNLTQKYSAFSSFDFVATILFFRNFTHATSAVQEYPLLRFSDVDKTFSCAQQIRRRVRIQCSKLRWIPRPKWALRTSLGKCDTQHQESFSSPHLSFSKKDWEKRRKEKLYAHLAKKIEMLSKL